MNRNYSRGVFCCLVATVSWGGMFPVMTSALEHVDPFTFTCVRISIAAAAFLLLLCAREGRASLRVTAREGTLAWVLGSIAFVGFGFLVFLGQQMAGPRGALMASIMMATQPMLGLLVNWVIRKARPPLVSFVFILASFAGVILVATDGHFEALLRQPSDYGAYGLIVLGALCWVLYTVGVVFFPQWSPLKYTAMTTGLGLGSIYLFTATLCLTGWLALPPAAAFRTVAPQMVYMALVAGFVGVLCWNRGNRIITPLNGVLFMDLVPITAFAVSAIGGVVPTSAQLWGAGLSCAALVGNNFVLRRHSNPRTTASVGSSTPPRGLQSPPCPQQ